MRAQRRYACVDVEPLHPVRERAPLLEPMSELVQRIKDESQKARQMAANCNRNVPRRVRLADLTNN